VASSRPRKALRGLQGQVQEGQRLAGGAVGLRHVGPIGGLWRPHQQAPGEERHVDLAGRDPRRRALLRWRLVSAASLVACRLQVGVFGPHHMILVVRVEM